MSNAVLLVGDTGSGKSSAIESLDPKETFIIQSVRKELPWKGSRKIYQDLTTQNKDGRKIYQPDLSAIPKAIEHIAKTAPHIKTIIIDDANYLLSTMYLSRHTANEKNPFDKFSDIADMSKNMIQASQNQRDDLDVFFMWHTNVDDNGRTGIVTIGRFLEEKYKIEGAFTVTLFAEKVEVFGKKVEYRFVTGDRVMNIAKSPRGMFPKVLPNDLQLVKETMKKYYEEE